MFLFAEKKKFIGIFLSILPFYPNLTVLFSTTQRNVRNHQKINRFLAFFGIFGLAIGAISGGVIVRRHKFSGRGAAILILVLSMVNIALFFSKAFFGCYSTVSTVGANGRYVSLFIFNAF